jgi:hypothetical protein
LKFIVQGVGTAQIELTEDEALTVRHCLLEALEALDEDEFRLRTGGMKSDAETLLVSFKRLNRALAYNGEASGNEGPSQSRP